MQKQIQDALNSAGLWMRHIGEHLDSNSVSEDLIVCKEHGKQWSDLLVKLAAILSTQITDGLRHAHRASCLAVVDRSCPDLIRVTQSGNELVAKIMCIATEVDRCIGDISACRTWMASDRLTPTPLPVLMKSAITKRDVNVAQRKHDRTRNAYLAATKFADRKIKEAKRRDNLDSNANMAAKIAICRVKCHLATFRHTTKILSLTKRGGVDESGELMVLNILGNRATKFADDFIIAINRRPPTQAKLKSGV